MKYLDAFTYLALRLTMFVLVVIPAIYLINHFTDLSLALKVGHGEGISLPDELAGIVFIEGALLVFLGLLFLIRKLFLRTPKKENFGQKTKSWKSKQILGCQWDPKSRSVNGIPLKTPLKDLEAVFGAPQATSETKLAYHFFGLDIFVGDHTGTVVLFMFYIVGDPPYKPCTLKSQLNDGSWHTFSSRDTDDLIHSFFGTPAQKTSLKDGFYEIYYWEETKIQVFYTLKGTLNLILFCLKK